MSLPTDITKEMQTTPVTRGINLMSFLLGGVTYEELYVNRFSDGSPTSGLGKLIANAKNLHDHPNLQTDPQGNPYDVEAELVGTNGVLIQIEGMLTAAGYPNISLGNLFTEKAPKDSPLAKIVTLLSDFFTNAGTRMNHFCTPFMYMQDTDAYVSDTDWKDFINGCGKSTLTELFQDGDSAVRKSVSLARKNFILLDKSKRVGVHSPVGGNGKWCNGNSCVDSGDPDTWCNMNENGTDCSPMSDHAP
tara:strand:- start:1547 stop:2287 length:741 start_codon:yes stop_codon:yes gene_type:complete